MPEPTPAPIAALATAAPGWSVTVASPVSGDRVTVPVAAWAARPTLPGETHAEIEAVFAVDGGMWSASEYIEIFGSAVEVHAPANEAAQ